MFYIVEAMSSQGSARTVVWGTGNVGRAAIRAVDAHPDLDLAGVIVHNPDKVGKDAGELADLDRSLGVAATADVDAALAEADAVVYAASGEVRPVEALADINKAIRVGACVVTPSGGFRRSMQQWDLRVLRRGFGPVF